MWPLVPIEAFDFQRETYLKHIKETLKAATGPKFYSEVFNSLIYQNLQSQLSTVWLSVHELSELWDVFSPLFLYLYRSKKYNTDKWKLIDLRNIQHRLKDVMNVKHFLEISLFWYLSSRITQHSFETYAKLEILSVASYRHLSVL